MITAALRRKATAQVRRGGLIAYATASCFGIGCDPGNARAVQSLLRLKRRPRRKGLILIADDFRLLSRFVHRLSSADEARAGALWPGPHTWLIPASRKALPSVRGRHGNVAVRVDAHPDAVRICRLLNMALTSSSLNRAGRRPVRTYREALRQFGARVLVIPGQTGRDKAPSTIADFVTGRVMRSSPQPSVGMPPR